MNKTLQLERATVPVADLNLCMRKKLIINNEQWACLHNVTLACTVFPSTFYFLYSSSGVLYTPPALHGVATTRRRQCNQAELMKKKNVNKYINWTRFCNKNDGI